MEKERVNGFIIKLFVICHLSFVIRHSSLKMFSIKKVGIIGEGKMGTSIFFHLLDFQFELVWFCSRYADIEKLTRQFGRRIRRSFDSGIIDQARYDKLLQISITTDIDKLQDCDLIIEAIPEDIAEKKKLFHQLDKIVNAEAIFTSNSSSINPSDLMPQSAGSRQFAGIHFFYPVPLKDIAEVILASSTKAHTCTIIESFLNAIHRRYIILDEQNSFILNKIFLDFQNAAFRIVYNGPCTYYQMDQLVKKNFFPFGVFDFCDSVGLDTMLASIQHYSRDYPDKNNYAMFISRLTDLVAAGKSGVKTHKGFYSYPMEDITGKDPEHTLEIIDHLRHTWLSSCERFTARSSVPTDRMNHAIKEYFGIEHGPFEKN